MLPPRPPEVNGAILESRKTKTETQVVHDLVRVKVSDRLRNRCIPRIVEPGVGLVLVVDAGLR